MNLANKPKAKWLEPKKLAQSELDVHYKAIAGLMMTIQPNGHGHYHVEGFKEHLVPLMLHHNLRLTALQAVAEIEAHCGLPMSETTYVNNARLWGVPSANSPGAGRAKPRHAPNSSRRFRFTG